ncbi:hypothetical protein [Kitasatospora sp. NPDC057936]|uniref:hypothetical protein n=1 Tax=Kitasatospora sp. NPDC057936 TaxID=3346283 RepID=UPI0036DEE2C3
MHQNRNGLQPGVAGGVVGCWVGEGWGAGPVFGVVVLGAGFAGGSAGGGGAAADVGGPDGDAAADVVLLDGFGRVLEADGCGRAVAAAVVADAGAAGAAGIGALFCDGDPVPAEAGVTAPSELPPASSTVASPQTTTPAADTARTRPRARPARRRADRRADWRDGAVDGASTGRVGSRPAPSPVVASAARPQPGQESAPLRWRRQGVQ